MATGPRAAGKVTNDADVTPDAEVEGRDLEADIKQLRADVAQLTEHLKEIGSESVTRVRREAEKKAAHLKENAEDIQDDVVEAIREKPLQAMAMAAGVGFLLAMIMRR